MMFEITESAATQVLTAAEQGGTEGMALRMAAKRKEDGSIDYLMGFDEAKENDLRFTSRGIDIIMGPQFLELLDDAVMDYVELTEGDFRFIFMNPEDTNYAPAPSTKRGKSVPK
jgi:iron-sulfur cluster assembly protein